MMRLGDMLLKKLEPVPEDSNDKRWKWFENCLGALDGTHIKLRVPSLDRQDIEIGNEININVLGVCSQDGFFIYVLPGWEGFAIDGRVLHDAISRRNGLRVPRGYYYLVDAGYTNCVDLLENEVQEMGVDVDGMENTPIQNMDASDEWATFRNTLANEMFTAFASNSTFR
ncbi:uncharacterized protein LOC129319564 [Prosopis cineraria]|uniref:uncharacterized protein LOC129319564 n=1 Tax=Prosopis cineraria TaxID=364024 RepID=UPI00240EC600|nr:uncharacterized protein LOC129319564 [Prosopis cineraria]